MLSSGDVLPSYERDRRLVAEGLQQGDFPRGKRTLGLIPDGEHTETVLGHPEGHGENFPNPGWSFG
jgi:hypothetical protein